MEEPTLIIIGGANGSGKTTLAKEIIPNEQFPYLGADEIAFKLNPSEPLQAAVQAGRIFNQTLKENIEQKKSLIVESTLSGISLTKHLRKAKSFGYVLRILFVYLDSPTLCVKRVEARVAKGGHYVHAEDIERRFYRSNNNFWNIYKDLADEWSLFFNAGSKIIQVAGGDQDGLVIFDQEKFEQWKEMVKK
jgi:predicted ABC-type ATPase